MIQTCPCACVFSFMQDISTVPSPKSSTSLRPADWPERLAAVVKTWQKIPFTWGKHDCAHFAAACLTAVSGRDWAAIDLGVYHTRGEALAQMKRLGFADLPAAVTALLGPPQHCAPQRGDLVTLRTPHGPALGICLGAELAAPGPQGLSFLPLSTTHLSWRV